MDKRSTALDMRAFDIPDFYYGPIISRVKKARRILDPRKKDFSPTVLDFGPVRFKIARHFGFCYGVENAVERAYRSLQEHPDRRIFLLSEMIHNPHVNRDLQKRGVRFLRTTLGEQLIPFDELQPEDIVIIPAFGTTLEIQEMLSRRGVDIQTYNTTCPFVEKVWKRSAQIGQKRFTIVIHGKRYHEETRATFSHAKRHAPVVVVRDLEEAEKLAQIIRRDVPPSRFFVWFADRYSPGFDPERDLSRIGVVNQTTMLATETQAIAHLLREAMITRYGRENLHEHFADTSDTLCYATHENQQATLALIQDGGDLAIVVGGYNSSNTSHLVELCAQAMPTYFIRDAEEIRSPEHIRHFDLEHQQIRITTGWLPAKQPVDIVLTAGASCPDILLDEVIQRLLTWYPAHRAVEDVLAPFEAALESESPSS